MSNSAPRIARFAAIFAGGTLISRILGLVRDIAVAAWVPAGAKDAFIAAFRLPNMLRELIGEGATNAAFVPVLTEYRDKHGLQEFRDLASATFGFMIAALAVITCGGIVLLQGFPAVLSMLEPFTNEPPMSAEEKAAFVELARWTFPYLFFIGLAAFAMGPLFISKHYSTPAWAPALLNIALIAVLLLPIPFENKAHTLVLGVWIGGIAQMAVLWWAMARHAGIRWPRFRRHPGVGRMILLLFPVIAGQAAGEVNKLFDTMFALSLTEGTVFGLYAANRLVQFPLSLFGLAVAAALLPTLSESAARNDIDTLRRDLRFGLRQSFFLIAPAMMGLIVLREPLLRLMFERGAFTPAHTSIASDALGYYAAGLWAFAWVRVTVNGFYALQDTRTPVIIASCAIVLNILLNFALVGFMAHSGLALSTTISYVVNFMLVFTFLGMRVGTIANREFILGIVRILFATAVMSALCYGLALRLPVWVGDEGFFAKSVVAIIPVTAGATAYIAIAHLMNMDEYAQYRDGVMRRLRR